MQVMKRSGLHSGGGRILEEESSVSIFGTHPAGKLRSVRFKFGARIMGQPIVTFGPKNAIV